MIRRCNVGDFDGVLQLLRQLWPDKQLDPAQLRVVYDSVLTSEFQFHLCAVEGENLVGFGSLSLRSSLWEAGCLGHIDELIVDQKHRQRGIGLQLLFALIDLARQNGCGRIELDSAFHRTAAHEFYESQGFENRAYLFSRLIAG